MALRDELLAEWRANAQRWEEVAAKAREAGLQAWNPGLYAFDVYSEFLRRYPPERGAVMGVGLNPGPYGMAQTGIPFTDCRTARDALGLNLEIPGRAPADLVARLRKPNGKWRATYERSSLGVYAFLAAAWKDLGTAYRNWWVGNPCPLLFLDPHGWNVTPADPQLRRIAAMNELRRRAVERFAEVLGPRAVVLLGNDVQKEVGPVAERIVGRQRVVTYRHPAREPPRKWGEGLARELEKRDLL